MLSCLVTERSGRIVLFTYVSYTCTVVLPLLQKRNEQPVSRKPLNRNSNELIQAPHSLYVYQKQKHKEKQWTMCLRHSTTRVHDECLMEVQYHALQEVITVCMRTIQRAVQEIIKWTNTYTTRTENDELDKYIRTLRTYVHTYIHTKLNFPLNSCVLLV